MKLSEQAHSCLMDVLYKKIPFKLAVENICTKNTVFREDRKNLTNITGCSLRHFYIYEDLISRLKKDFVKEQKVAIYLFLSNKLFVPVIPSTEIEKLLKKYSVAEKDIETLEELSKDKTKLIPDIFSSDSIEYLNYRFNIPIWVLKMWMKHFNGYTYKIVKSINKPLNHYAILNSQKIDEKTLLEKHPEIKPSQFENLYLYEGSVAPKRHSLFKDGTLSLITPAEHYLLGKLDLDVIRKIALYSEVHNNLPIQLMSILGTNKYQMEIIAGASEGYFPAKKDTETFKMTNVNVYDANSALIVTCLSEKVHTFFVMPKNTQFAEFRKTPDYFNRVDQSQLDSYIANQKKSLDDASQFIEDGGLLIYSVATMDKKETIQITEHFLENHKDFTLVEQKQFLPFDKYDSVRYFAIFRKEGSDD